MQLALLFFALLHPFTVIALIALAAIALHAKAIVGWLLTVLASGALFGTTIAYPGYGSKLANGGTAGTSYTNVAQLKKGNFSGLKADFEEITNLDSPSIFK